MISDYEKELRDIASAKAKLDAREKEIKNEIKKEHTGDKTTNYGGIQVQVISGYYTTEFDLERFESENAELFAEYQKESYKAPTLKIVLVKKTEAK